MDPIASNPQLIALSRTRYSDLGKGIPLIVAKQSGRVSCFNSNFISIEKFGKKFGKISEKSERNYLKFCKIAKRTLRAKSLRSRMLRKGNLNDEKRLLKIRFKNEI